MSLHPGLRIYSTLSEDEEILQYKLIITRFSANTVIQCFQFTRNTEKRGSS